MEDIERAAAALRRGEVVVIPTDTLYGIAAVLVPGAIEKVFLVKGRPSDRPLPVLGSGIDELSAIATFDDRSKRLAATFWPGALTLVLPRAEGFEADLGGTSAETVAVRVPNHPIALALLRQSGPLAVTSANRSGDPPARTVDEARAALGDAVAAYLDGGQVEIGLPSTIVRLTEGIEVVRQGAISEGEIYQALRS